MSKDFIYFIIVTLCSLSVFYELLSVINTVKISENDVLAKCIVNIYAMSSSDFAPVCMRVCVSCAIYLN